MEEPKARLLEGIPLFAGIEAQGLEALARTLQPVEFAPAARLVRQGRAADGAYLIGSGTAGVITALPGGGEVTVGELGPGSVLGEMALLERGTRSASVIAREPVSGYFIERDAFRLLLLQRNRAAFVLQNRITLSLCQRLRDLNAKVMENGEAPPPLPPSSVPDAGRLRSATVPFDWRRFLPLLPPLRRWKGAEVEQLVSLARAMELERGEVLFREGEPAAACYLVVRGAVEVTGARDDARHRIGILGPGRLCGILAMIEGQAHSMTSGVRENAMLLEIGRPAFDRLYSGDDRIAARFHEAVNGELLTALARTNNHLTRLVSQARIRGGRRERRQAEDLQRALGGQECRPAGD